VKKNPQLETIVNTLVSASDPEEVKGLYAQWAQSYDDDLDAYGYVAPKLGVRMLTGLVVDKNALIHDAGCGTGQVGALLNDLGYSALHGSDFSSDMLEQAKTLGCYEKLESIDFGKTIELDSDTYAAVISIGVYTKRFKQHFIDEMLRIVQPGGYFVFTCRELYYDEVMETVTRLLKELKIASLVVEYDDYLTGQGASAYYVALKKSASKT